MSVALLTIAAAPIATRADTVATLLGNFTINQYCGLLVGDSNVNLRYTVVYGQLPALRELHAADADSDGVTTQAERDAYVGRLAPSLRDQLNLVVDGAPLPLRVTYWTTSLPTEQGGFSLRVDIDLEGALPKNTAHGEHKVEFANRNYAGRFGWQELAVQAIPSIKVFGTNAYSTSLTAGLTEAVAELPPSGPLSERTVQFAFTHGALPSGAQLIQPRPGTAPSSAQGMRDAPGDEEGLSLQRATKHLVDLISARDVAPHVAILALLAAMLLGAVHAFSPGHGKTVVGAYLIGSRATARHALFLGATVTLTHTIGVFALGFATLVASEYVVPERLIPLLSLASGLLVLGMGIALVAQRWGAARRLLGSSRTQSATKSRSLGAIAFRPVAKTAAFGKPGRGLALALVGGHAHDDLHHHEHSHDHDAGHSHHGPLFHSHGGRVHSHLPPGTDGEAITWKSLLALGVSGGLVPCPSAMVLLLAAVSLNKTAYGLLLVLAFSIGLALTLVAVGLVFLYARNRIYRPRADARWPALVPLASAGAITLIGAALCYVALASF
jgi:ABC-type nickel/cobalt efflux system permease component RcnA